jgi:hypothetical protein
MSIHFDKGRYKVRVVAQAFGPNRNNNYCQSIEIEPFEMYPASPDADPLPVDGPTRQVRFFFQNEQNAEISIRQLRALGWTGASFADLADGKWSIVGQEFDARCTHRTYDREGIEEQTEDWEFLVGSPGIGVATPERKVVMEMDAKFARLLKGGAKPAVPPPAPRPPVPPPAANHQDDGHNIPF